MKLSATKTQYYSPLEARAIRKYIIPLVLAAIFVGPALAQAQVVAPTYKGASGSNEQAIGVVVLNSDGASSTDAVTPVAGSLVNGIVGKASAGILYGGEITTAATAGYLYVFNSATVPADGAVTAGIASGNYQLCRPVAVTTSLAFALDPPERYANGISAAFSTTACGTLTKSATAVFIKVRAK